MSAQTWDPKQYRENAGFVAFYGASVLDLLGDVSGQRILDLGCGDGVLTASLAEKGASVLGIDSSAEMISDAVGRGLDASVMDATALSFENEFDAVFTNAVLHWIRDHDAVLSGVHRALKPDGRFVGEFGGHGNIAAVRTALLAGVARLGYDITDRYPHNYPTETAFRQRLVMAGFEVESTEIIHRPTPLPEGVRGWYATFGKSALAGLSPEEAEEAVAHAEYLLQQSLCDDQGIWIADYVRLRFVAHRS
ncbi:MAG: class I SAM-dependent methyltransferase [Armatimonadota bacterium]